MTAGRDDEVRTWLCRSTLLFRRLHTSGAVRALAGRAVRRSDRQPNDGGISRYAMGTRGDTDMTVRYRKYEVSHRSVVAKLLREHKIKKCKERNHG